MHELHKRYNQLSTADCRKYLSTCLSAKKSSFRSQSASVLVEVMYFAVCSQAVCFWCRRIWPTFCDRFQRCRTTRRFHSITPTSNDKFSASSASPCDDYDADNDV